MCASQKLAKRMIRAVHKTGSSSDRLSNASRIDSDAMMSCIVENAILSPTSKILGCFYLLRCALGSASLLVFEFKGGLCAGRSDHSLFANRNLDHTVPVILCCFCI